MKFAKTLLCLLLWTCVSSAAESLIVTTDGRGIRADAVRKSAEKISYRDIASAAETNMPAGSVDGIVPLVQRGTTYSPADVQAALDLAGRLKLKYSGLTRDLNQIQSEWQSLRKAGGDSGAEIARIVEEFRRSPKGTKQFKSASTALGMLKFKDLQGKYAAQIDSTLRDVKNEYLISMSSLVSAAATNERITVDDFILLKERVRDIGEYGDAARKESANAILVKTRPAALEKLIGDSVNMYQGKKDIGLYLASRSLLLRLKVDVADAGPQAERVDSALARQIEEVSKAMPAYRFEEGFPLSREDLQAIEESKKFCAMVRSDGAAPESQQCMLLPARRPEVVKPGVPLVLSLRLVFNRVQPANRVFGFVFLVNGEKGAYSHVVSPDRFQIQDGHANLTLKEDFATMPADFKVATDRSGQYCVFVYLVGKKDDDPASEEWVPLSRFLALMGSGGK